MLINPQPIGTLPRPIPHEGVYIEHETFYIYKQHRDPVKIDHFDESGYREWNIKDKVHGIFLRWSYSITGAQHGNG